MAIPALLGSVVTSMVKAFFGKKILIWLAFKGLEEGAKWTETPVDDQWVKKAKAEFYGEKGQ